MSRLERKIDMLLRYLVAETESEREEVLGGLKAMVSSDTTPDKEEAIRLETEGILREIGVPCHLMGYECIVAAVRLTLNDPGLLQRVTGDLYPRVAKAQWGNQTKGNVERAIRHAIEVAWDRGDIDVFEEYFGNTVSAIKGKPTNSEFIARLVREVRNRTSYLGVTVGG